MREGMALLFLFAACCVLTHSFRHNSRITPETALSTSTHPGLVNPDKAATSSQPGSNSNRAAERKLQRAFELAAAG